MDSSRIYAELIARARARRPEGYVERHHVVPKCLGGTDEPENIVALTAREHFVAHQLLVRMHPMNRALSWAVFLMSKRERFNPGQARSYAALKEAAARDISESQIGVNSGGAHCPG